MLLKGKTTLGDGFTIVISLFFAIIVWGLLKLSDSYSSVYHYRVEVTTNLPDKEFVSLSTGPLSLRGNSSGYQLLKHRLETKQNKNIVRLDLESSLLKSQKNDSETYYLLVRNVESHLKEKIDMQINIESFLTDTLFFQFHTVARKRVKVALKRKFSFEKEFMPTEALSISPDSIDIQGEPSAIQSIDSVVTQLEIRKGINKNIQGVVPLKKIEGILFSSHEVYYSQSVGRFYEATVEVPIQVINLPEGYSIELVPSVAEVCYRAIFANKHDYSEQDFNIFVDYNSLSDQLSGATKIEIGELPRGVLSLHLNKYFIENYIVSNK